MALKITKRSPKTSAAHKRSKLRAYAERGTKNFRPKGLHSKAVSKPQQIIAVNTTLMPLNIDFYANADGWYSSYWVGKLMAVMQRKGGKKTISKHLYAAFTVIKFMTGRSPLLLLLETLDKVKPSFRLRNYIVRRTIIKEYPIAVLRPRQLILATHWLKEEIRASSNASGNSVSANIAAKLLDFRANPKKNNLTKKRNEYMKRTIKAQFNVRYNFG